MLIKIPGDCDWYLLDMGTTPERKSSESASSSSASSSSIMAAECPKRLSHTGFPIQVPVPVFTSPSVDLQRQVSPLESDETGPTGSDVNQQYCIQHKPEPIPCYQNEARLDSPPVHINQCLTDRAEAEGIVSNGHGCDTKAGVLFSDQRLNGQSSTSVNFVQTPLHPSEELLPSEFNDHGGFGSCLDPSSGVQIHQQFGAQNIELQFSDGQCNGPGASPQEANQHQHNIWRHLQYEFAMPCKQNTDETHATSPFIPSLIPVPPHYENGGISDDCLAGNTPTSQNPKLLEASSQTSHEKRRKMPSHNNDSKGFKHCNCKRSKCLKLYCECFAGGYYCTNSCSCENCFNRCEYEDTVNDMRTQIETRNPHAFAPRVVSHAVNSPANMMEEANWTTLSSARHKRGCNCKRSKCLKRYCECFQSKVGCSNACRCDGCNNSFGRKAESIYKRVVRAWENPPHEQWHYVETQTDFTSSDTHQSPKTWKELAEPTHLTSSQHSSLGPMASTLPLRKHFHQGSSSLQASATTLTPKLYEKEALTELTSGTLFDILKGAETPEILDNASPVIEAVSPNPNQATPPQVQTQELNSSSPLQGFGRGHDLILSPAPF